MAGIEFLEGEPREVVIVGDADAKDTQSMRRAIDSRYLPNLVTIFKPVDSGDPEIVRYAEFTRPHTAVEGRATAYVCENYACQLPTTDTQEMLRLIDGDPK
jgi:hypothetical protein